MHNYCVCEPTQPSKISILLSTFNNAVQFNPATISTPVFSQIGSSGVLFFGWGGGGGVKQLELESYHSLKFRLCSDISIQALAGFLKIFLA
jgi:hypothetical protein